MSCPADLSAAGRPERLGLADRPLSTDLLYGEQDADGEQQSVGGEWADAGQELRLGPVAGPGPPGSGRAARRSIGPMAHSTSRRHDGQCRGADTGSASRSSCQRGTTACVRSESGGVAAARPRRGCCLGRRGGAAASKLQEVACRCAVSVRIRSAGLPAHEPLRAPLVAVAPGRRGSGGGAGIAGAAPTRSAARPGSPGLVRPAFDPTAGWAARRWCAP
jgi:hypothetical protein